MQTVRILGHPVHRVLIAFPIGLLATAALFGHYSISRRETRSGQQHPSTWSGPE